MKEYIDFSWLITKDRISHQNIFVLLAKRTKGHANLVAIMSVTSKCWQVPFYDSVDKILTTTHLDISK
jgi:hypothetical protein